MSDLDSIGSTETEDKDFVELSCRQISPPVIAPPLLPKQCDVDTGPNAEYASPVAQKRSGKRRVDWSSDSDSDIKADDTHKPKQNPKPRSAPRTRTARTSTRQGKEAILRSGTGVGRRPVGDSRKRNLAEVRQIRSMLQEDIAEDDHLMEHTLPDYLQARRTLFDQRSEKFRAAGLKLPPVYDDVDFSDDERLQDLAEKPDFPTATTVAAYKDKQLSASLGIIPAPFAQWLREYQVTGAAFLHKLFVYQIGGILGDDMGLGKTVQVIAFLTAAFGKTSDERDAKRMRKMRRANAPWYPRVLVICPGSLIENWKSELDRWGWWHVDVFHGSDKEIALEAAGKGRLEIMITTYTTYRMNRGAINLIEWDCVIADECHQIKVRSSEIAQAMNEINALCRIGLTGTAIQNSYDELWTLLNWTNPGKFGPISTWKHSISLPLKLGQSHDATVFQLARARKTAKALVENLLPHFFLRRMKSLIADQLPKKRDRVVFCPLTAIQADAYVNLLESDAIRCIAGSGDLCHCGGGKKAGWCCQQRLPVSNERWQRFVFPSMMNLQKLANHFAILIPNSNDANDKQARDLETLQIASPEQWRRLYSTRDSIMNYANPEFCGKWKVLRKLLSFWHQAGDKVLVFSHSVRLLKMLQLLFQHTTYNVSYLDGAMKYEDRAKIVDDFNSDANQFVFLISTKAGGTGLNIVSANKVVVVDPNWNPAHDLQAQDRAYRIGQLRDVEVFRLVSAGTIEEIVYARQIYKQQQANIGYTASHERRYFKGVQENKDQKGEIFGLQNMFSFDKDNILLRDIVNKTNVAESRAGVKIAGWDTSNSSTPSTPGNTSNIQDPDTAADESAISQLATMMLDEAESATSTSTTTPVTKSAPSYDPIQAILASAGVSYTHDNSEVIGSSKVETHLSRRAQCAEDKNMHLGGQTCVEATSSLSGNMHVFPSSPPASSQPPVGLPLCTRDDAELERHDALDGIEEHTFKGVNAGITTAESGTAVEKHRTRQRYNPPPDVRRRQLYDMARLLGYIDIGDGQKDDAAGSRYLHACPDGGHGVEHGDQCDCIEHGSKVGLLDDEIGNKPTDAADDPRHGRGHAQTAGVHSFSKAMQQFALLVEMSTQDERRSLLERYYSARQREITATATSVPATTTAPTISPILAPAHGTSASAPSTTTPATNRQV